MNAVKTRARSLLLLAGVAALLLPAARCGHKNSPEIQGASARGSGPSSGIAVSPGNGVNWSYGSFPPTLYEVQVLDLINSYRLGKGLPPFKWHDGMALVCGKNSADMKNRNFFSIVNPDGVDIYQRLVSSNPRIDFDNAWGFVVAYQGGGPNTSSNAVATFQAMLDNDITHDLMDSLRPTHFVVAGAANFYQSTFLFAQNVRP